VVEMGHPMTGRPVGKLGHGRRLPLDAKHVADRLFFIGTFKSARTSRALSHRARADRQAYGRRPSRRGLSLRSTSPATVVSAMRLEKPHSLSYQLIRGRKCRRSLWSGRREDATRGCG
jgi:hypothetical protein